jgi:hypothetical protein
MPDAQDRGWGAPCSGQTVVLARADGLRLPVRLEVADLIGMLIDLGELAGYDVLPGQTWGAACRKIAGTNVWSNHAWKLAVDLNAPSNPYASADWHRRNARGTRPFGLAIVCDIPEALIRLWEDHGFRWGGWYKTKPDPMHFEFMGSPADAASITARLRAFLAGNGQPAPPPARPPAQVPVPKTARLLWPTLSTATRASRPHHTSLCQQVTGAGVDGDYGPATRDHVRAYERAAGFTADGVVDARTAWRIIQNVLRDLGLYGGPLDGDPGPGTAAGVVALQQRTWPAEPARWDAAVGDDTTAALWWWCPK